MARHSKRQKNEDVNARKPVEVKAKGVTIRINPTTRRGRPHWIFSYYIAGRRIRPVKKSLEDAKRAALKIIDGLTNEPATIWTIDESRAREAYDAEKFLKKTGLESHRLDAIARDWAEAMKILDEGTSLVEACRYWVEKHGSNFVPQKPKVVIDSFLERKRLEGISEKHLENTRYQAERFERTFRDRDLHTLTVPELRSYLLGLRLSNAATIYHRNTLKMIFDHAVENLWCPKDHNPIKAIVFKRETADEIAFFKVKEIKRLFNKVANKEPDLIPYLVFATLAGIRPEEVRRMNWEWVSQEAVRLPGRLNGKRITKTGRPRQVPLCKAAQAWLTPYRHLTGNVLPERYREKLVRRLRKISGLTWIQDGLRHSYGSYRRAQTKDIAQLSEEMGNTVQVCMDHYANPHVDSKDAEAFFNLMPPWANVVNLEDAKEA